MPNRYRTDIQLVRTDNLYYGYRIVAPKHEWPFYAHADGGWAPTSIVPVSDEVEVVSHDFASGPIDERVAVTRTFEIEPGQRANALEALRRDHPLRGRDARRDERAQRRQDRPAALGVDGRVRLELTYRLGGGLGSLAIRRR